MEVSTGAVKISPSGMLYSPAQGIAVRPLIEKERSVSFPTIRTRSAFSSTFFARANDRDIAAQSCSTAR